jgi:hypothetical protein
VVRKRQNCRAALQAFQSLLARSRLAEVTGLSSLELDGYVGGTTYRTVKAQETRTAGPKAREMLEQFLEQVAEVEARYLEEHSSD